MRGSESSLCPYKQRGPSDAEIADVVAACVIDRPRRTVVIAGPIEGLRGGSDRTLRELREILGM